MHPAMHEADSTPGPLPWVVYVNVRMIVQLHAGWEKMFNWENEQEEARDPLLSYHPMETGEVAVVPDADPLRSKRQMLPATMEKALHGAQTVKAQVPPQQNERPAL